MKKLCIIGLCLSWLLFGIQNNYMKNKAISKCGGKNNIIEKYTNEGDIYYICK